MPPSRPKQAEDVRRTLTPADAHIALRDSGFEVRHANEVIALVAWDQVQAIFAYTRFIQGHRNLCLDFHLPPRSRGKEDQVVLNDGVSGWRQLVSRLPLAFASIDHAWETKAGGDAAAHPPVAAVVPNFVLNPVRVWPLL